ncbi:hypothetical protein, partial [Idiomarina baltica]|uniref:hypothetical protein n=1 Tax=Idiomarina baltica TaxID=190892 RepID=UPI002FDC90B7
SFRPIPLHECCGYYLNSGFLLNSLFTISKQKFNTVAHSARHQALHLAPKAQATVTWRQISAYKMHINDQH